jgi:hypothetical protein
MPLRPAISCFLSAGFIVSTWQAQTGDWQAVQDIPSGTYISIKNRHYRVKCIFGTATETELFCERRDLAGNDARIRFDRQTIRQIRLEHPAESGALGLIIGTGLGIRNWRGRRRERVTTRRHAFSLEWHLALPASRFGNNHA